MESQDFVYSFSPLPQTKTIGPQPPETYSSRRRIWSQEHSRRYLKKNNSQVQLRQEIVARLGIRQDPTDPASSPPSMAFDVNMLRRLKEQGILKSEDENELFKSFAGSGKPTVVSTKDCIWTIYNELSSHVDLDAAVQEQLLVTWYPVHNPRQTNTLKAIWANWHAMMDPFFV